MNTWTKPIEHQIASDSTEAVARYFVRQKIQSATPKRNRIVENTKPGGMIITGVTLPDQEPRGYAEIHLSDEDHKLLGEVLDDAAKKFDLKKDDETD